MYCSVLSPFDKNIDSNLQVMKRDILFKAKRADNGEWVEGLLIESKNDECHILVKNYNPIKKQGNGHWYIDSPCFQVNPETVCQFTGLIDKNGNKIFQNDEVVSDKKFSSANKAVVMWLEKRCGFYFIANTVGTDIVNRKPFQSAFKMNSIKVEITGNIHDK